MGAVLRGYPVCNGLSGKEVEDRTDVKVLT